MLSSIVFYSLDKAIKSYRQMAQASLDAAGLAITIDQWLVLQVLLEHDDLTQAEIGMRVFKDQASVARILRLLLGHGYLTEEAAPDGRRRRLRVSAAGEQMLAAVEPLVLNNRRRALQGLSPADTELLQRLLEQISANCAPPD
ncbi:MarR family winged helix-turn-helix transcriptional regulator [Hymenobacter persicinus]|uniref:MarR family transcriptional regulator n=1 Tax=Hymenobacter persicinus TaxID=2025506 RepID=A0A4Q5LAM8_9BACT|nr:MarR family transcriptional regulator [Hymenobacter persicinus]RYU79060.1 MarR family transcriptional regulator [Hymenobacter persicinus]